MQTPVERVSPGTSAHFANTHWSVVLSASTSETRHAAEALQKLCQDYWRPIYAFIRKHGVRREDAEDLTQAFFARLLEKKVIGAADPARGRFRSFLLASLRNFLTNEWDKAHAQKRGGWSTHLSLDVVHAEESLAAELIEQGSADKVFERQWALTVLAHTFSRLRQDYVEQNRVELFEQLKSTLIGEPESLPYSEIAAQCNLTEGAVKVAAHRMRKRYRELLFAQIAETVQDSAEVRDEIQALFAALGR